MIDGQERICSKLSNVKDAIDDHFARIAHEAKWEAKKAAERAAKAGA